MIQWLGRHRTLALIFAASILLCLGWRRLLLQGQVPVNGHMMAYVFPDWKNMHSAFTHPRLLLWNPARDLGEPYAADPQNMAFYPPFWMFLPFGDFSAFIRLWVVFHTLLAASFMALLAWRWYSSPSASFAAAVITGLNGFFIARVVFPQHFASAAWLPAILYFQEEGSALGLGSCVALQWLAGFPPFSILSVLAALGLALRQGSTGLKCWLKGGLWGAGLAAAGWLPFLQMMAHSTRSLVLSSGAADKFSVPPVQLIKEIFVPQWYAFMPRMSGDPGIVTFYVGLFALALAAWGAAKGLRERQIGLATAAAFLLSLGSWLPGYNHAAFLHIFRFPANWLLLASTGVAILAAAGVSRIKRPSRRWLCAALVAGDLVVFSQYKLSAWALPDFFMNVPPLARNLVARAGPSPVRIYHAEGLMNLWKNQDLKTPQDYLMLRELLAPSYGTAFGVQEAYSFQVLKFKDAAAFQDRLAAAKPNWPLLSDAGVSLVLDIAPGARSIGPKTVRLIQNKEAKQRIFLAGHGPGKVDGLYYSPGLARALITTPAPARAVFAESDYPGWAAFIDGKETPHQRFDGLFPSVMVPAGNHEVIFSFHSTAFELGLFISVLTLVLLLVLKFKRMREGNTVLGTLMNQEPPVGSRHEN